MADEGLVKMGSMIEELINYASDLEKENAKLQEQCKTASAAPVVSAECVADTCKALKDAGMISEDQVEQSKQAFLSDPEAIHRVAQKIVNASAQEKTASAEADLNGGTLVTGAAAPVKDRYAESMDRIQAILGIR